MSKAGTPLPYGRRGGTRGSDAGIRRVAPTFGKQRFMNHSAKANAHFLVESSAESLVGKILTLAPSVRAFRAQPFTVDLIEGVVLETTEAVAAARAKHKLYAGSKFYTPDFAVDWHSGVRTATEVKLEGYVGSSEYECKLAMARPILGANGYHFSKVVVPRGAEHPLRTNVNLLTQAARRSDLALTCAQVSEIESSLGDETTTLASFCERFAVSPNLVPVLLFSGVLAADLGAQSLDGNLQMRLAFGALDHLELLKGIEQ